MLARRASTVHRCLLPALGRSPSRLFMQRAEATDDSTEPSTSSSSRILIAVDGTAASGKGLLARRLAERFNLAHLDTGVIYRALGAQAIKAGVALNDEARLQELCGRLQMVDLSSPSLRTEEAGAAASKVSVHPAVRTRLLTLQRQMAYEPPPSFNGAVLDGRDIGTVVCPDAPAKLFITASSEVRAARRYKEIKARGGAAASRVTLDGILREILERDTRDRHRAVAPMRPAADALVIDTSDMTPTEVLDAAVAHVYAAYEKAGAPLACSRAKHG